MNSSIIFKFSSTFSSPGYCSNSHELTHVYLSDLDIPSFMNEGLAVYAQEINQMQKSFADPILSLIAVRQYQTTSQEAYQALRSLNSYFSENKISFNEKEPGQLFALYQ